MLGVLVVSLYTKLFSLLSLAFIYSLILRRPSNTNSDIVIMFGAFILVFVTLAGYFNLEFFFILLLYIYIGAVVVLFSLACMFIPIEGSNYSRTDLAIFGLPLLTDNTQMSNSPLSLTLEFSLCLTSFAVIERLSTTMVLVFHNESLNSVVNLLAWTSPLQMPTWISLSFLWEEISILKISTNVNSACALANSTLDSNLIVVFTIALALLLVLSGTLSWLRHTKPTLV